MRFNSCIIFFLLITLNLFGQQKSTSDKLWIKGGLITINFSQSALSNWSSGGQSSLSELNQINLFLNYSNKKHSWDNTLDLAYGLQRKSSEKSFKTDDKIDYASKYGYRAFDHVNYSGLFTFKTQFASGFNQNSANKISDFLAPAYLGAALGLDYNPSDDFTVLIAPFSNKTTIVNIQTLANEGSYGVKKAETDSYGKIIKPGNKIRSQFGGYFKFMMRKTILENVAFQTKIDLFSDYLKKPQNIDIYWDILFNFKINNFISASISSSLIYDDDIKITKYNSNGVKEITGPKIQFKEILAIGISYKL